MKITEAIRFIAVRSLGNLLLLLALYGVFWTFGPAFWYEMKFHIAQYRGIHFIASAEDFKNLGSSSSDQNPSISDVVLGPQEQTLTPVDTDFSILIPKIGARAKIIADVDPMDSSMFLPILKEGVAQSKGSAYPGDRGDVYLFAHSTDNWWDVGRYNAIFYLLKDLSKGDTVQIYYKGQQYTYIVSSTMIKDPQDTSLLDNAGKSKSSSCCPSNMLAAGNHMETSVCHCRRERIGL